MSRNWRGEILNYFDHRITNGFVEGKNNRLVAQLIINHCCHLLLAIYQIANILPLKNKVVSSDVAYHRDCPGSHGFN